MRLLLLHGYGRSAKKVMNQCPKLWKRMTGENWEIIPRDAPFPERNENSRSWLKKASSYEGLSESIHSLSDVSPDFIMGFSQGAFITGVISGIKENINDPCFSEYRENVEQLTCNLKGIILFSGALPNYEKIRNQAYQRSIQIPSLHIIGTQDKIITPEQSELLAKQYIKPSILYHPEGHIFPTEDKYFDEIINWIHQHKASQIQAKL